MKNPEGDRLTEPKSDPLVEGDRPVAGSLGDAD
jgi:hypothetical protein